MSGKDITGHVFGDYTAVRFIEKRKNNYYWLCVCKCGEQRKVAKGNLMRGSSTGCGCAKKDKTAKKLTKHGKTGTSIYRIWSGMINRCHNSRYRLYKDYGGRGISVCDRWKNSFEDFYADMGDKPRGMSIDRIDNDGDYEPGNCRWASRRMQNRNKRSNRNLTFNNETRCLSEWEAITGLNRQTIMHRVNAGWPIWKALTLSTNLGDRN